MMRLLALAGLLALLQDDLRLLEAEVAKKKDDPVAALRLLQQKALGQKALPLARRTLFAGLDRSISEGLKALADDRADLAQLHLLRAAHLARPYDEGYSRLLGQIVLRLRRRARAEVALVARDPTKLDEARKGFLAKSWPKEFVELEKKVKDWKSPAPDVVDAEIARWTAITAGPSNGCAVCKGIGDAACGGCKDGLVPQACAVCASKGTVACAVCEGKCTVDHAGYAGTIRFDIDHEVRIPIGKKAMVFPPQIVTWTLSPCSGKGSCALDAQSEPKNGTPGNRASVTRTCEEVWKELRRWAFNGRAKIEVTGASGRMERLSSEAARRFFADYDECKQGKVSCDACAKKGTTACAPCAGRGQKLGPCSVCAGVGLRPCDSCALAGDASWLAGLVPSSAGPGDALRRHADAVSIWLAERSRAEARHATLAGQLKAARQGLDSTAKLTDTAVNLACEVCKGRSSTCETCWGVGRREFAEGTPQFEKYRVIARLEKQLGEVAVELKKPAPPADLRLEELAAKEPAPDPKPAPSPRPVELPKSTSGVTDRDISVLPEDLQAKVREGDRHHEEGAAHLKRAKESTDGEMVQKEAKGALDSLRKAQACYAEVQEQCDARGLDLPRAILDRARKNLQALVMARKAAP